MGMHHARVAPCERRLGERVNQCPEPVAWDERERIPFSELDSFEDEKVPTRRDTRSEWVCRRECHVSRELEENHPALGEEAP